MTFKFGEQFTFKCQKEKDSLCSILLYWYAMWNIVFEWKKLLKDIFEFIGIHLN